MSDYLINYCENCGEAYSSHLGACPRCYPNGTSNGVNFMAYPKEQKALENNEAIIVKAQKGAKEASSLEQAFMTAWALTGLEMPITEYRFCMSRRWRADFAFIEKKVIVELMGGGYNYGRHHRPQGYKNDCEKHNMAIELGWRVLQYTEVSNDMIEQIKRVLSQ